MKKLAVFMVMSLIGLTFLGLTVYSTRENEQRQKQIFERSAKGKAHFIGTSSEFANTNDITDRDVRLMWEKVSLGMQLIDNFWSVKFAQNGYAYRSPSVKYYTAPFSSSCGEIKMNNAFYCSADHTIYFDAYFFVRLMKGVGDSLGTDGDMAIIFVLAHEWGHAAQGLTGRLTRLSMLNETNADCSAGAFTQYAAAQNLLETGDAEEALTALNLFGDELPYYADGAHGTSEERVAVFKRGVRGGLVACGGFNR